MEKTLNLSGYKCQILHFNSPGVPIVFLHGLSYTSEIWQNIGITELLIQKHIAFLALDMPYGPKTQCHPKTRDLDKNLTVIAEAVNTVLGSSAPVLVGASIGGNMALHYAARFPVKGLFLVGPARALEPDLVESYSSFKFPTTIVWGSLDTIIRSEDMRTLSDKLPNSKLIVYSGAGHSAYRDQADKFKQNLLELYLKAEQA